MVKSEDFDYIVVGSGAGGGPLAANLANAGFRVLLMEAGGDPCTEDKSGRGRYLEESRGRGGPVSHANPCCSSRAA